MTAESIVSSSRFFSSAHWTVVTQDGQPKAVIVLTQSFEPFREEVAAQVREVLASFRATGDADAPRATEGGTGVVGGEATAAHIEGSE
jgi:hypothetical protein